MALPTLLVFNQELAALLKAGLPLLQALHMLAERQREPHFKAILEQVRERVKSGVELSEAFAEFGDAFPPLYASSLKAGERTGELEAVVRRFVRYLRLVLDARKRVYSALVYPALLLGLSVTMVAAMTLYIIPRFSVFYEAMDLKELPALTRITMGISHFLRSNLLLLVAAAVAGTIALRRWAATGPGRLALDRLRLHLPFLGLVLHRFALSEFCRSLATLLAGGLPLVPALEISTRAVGNSWVRSRLEPSIPRVREGQALHVALGETAIVPALALDMVEVGEATGSLDADAVQRLGVLRRGGRDAHAAHPVADRADDADRGLRHDRRAAAGLGLPADVLGARAGQVSAARRARAPARGSGGE